VRPPPPKKPNPFDEDEHTVAMTGGEHSEAVAKAARLARQRAQPATAATLQGLPPVGAKPAASAQKFPPVGPGKPVKPPVVQRAGSTFVGQVSTRRELLLGKPNLAERPPPTRTSLSHEELTQVASRFDGQRASPSTEIPATQLKPIEAETTSAPGGRHALLLKAVIDQFAPQTNSRYSVGECGHVFVGDFARAMGCAIPRFKGAQEMSISAVCGWFRSLSSGSGWIRVATIARASELAAQGFPVIALAKGGKDTSIAVARPDEPAPDRSPFLSSASGFKRGAKLTTQQAFGTRQAEYWFHE
jgi:hypothetical protein